MLTPTSYGVRFGIKGVEVLKNLPNFSTIKGSALSEDEKNDEIDYKRLQGSLSDLLAKKLSSYILQSKYARKELEGKQVRARVGDVCSSIAAGGISNSNSNFITEARATGNLRDYWKKHRRVSL
ncbi:hypothetical protein Tco_0417173 [Tanacetum coccineum]